MSRDARNDKNLCSHVRNSNGSGRMMRCPNSHLLFQISSTVQPGRKSALLRSRSWRCVWAFAGSTRPINGGITLKRE